MPTDSPRAATLDETRCYDALLARDARFDGRFFVGVTSTGVYCRPVCRVRTPLRRNCRFFGHAAGAEAAGFRPCLRCRPELAPGLSLIDSSDTLASQAARLIETAAAQGRDLPMTELAGRLGVTDRHLRRIFAERFGVSPLAFQQTHRLLQAKQLLTDTGLSVTEIAHASGFGSLRRFHAAFAEHYRMSPTALRTRREHASTDAGTAAPIVVRLGLRPPYDAAGMRRFLAARALPGIECVDEPALAGHGGGPALRYARTIALSHEGQRLAGWLRLSLEPDATEVRAEVDPALAPVLGELTQRLRQALDLDADPAQIDPVIDRLGLPPCPGLRLPGAFDGFETAVRIVLGQQVTVAAARTLTRRMVAALGEPLSTPIAGLDRLFPTAQRIAAATADEIGRLGIVRQRVGALQALARAVVEGRLELHRGAPLAGTLAALRALPGFGDWTVQLIAMRALAWPDAYPATDIGLLNALGSRDVRAAQARAEDWKPWRSYAVIRWWQTLEKTDA